MWAQDWSAIIDVVLPYPEVPSFDVTDQMVEQEYDALKMFKTAEEFFTSLGLDPMTQTFWNKSLFTRPEDKAVLCQGSAHDFFSSDDFRYSVIYYATTAHNIFYNNGVFTE